MESISHYRAIPIHLSDGTELSYTRHTLEDNEGYLWISGGNGVQRYNGYEITHFPLTALPSGHEYSLSYLFVDDDQQLWVGNRGLYQFNQHDEKFELKEATSNLLIKSILDDGEGNLWLAGKGMGMVKYNKASEEISTEPALKYNPDAPDNIHSIAMDTESNVLWIVSEEGIHSYDINSQILSKLDTEFDGYTSTFIIRDIAIDHQHRKLWVGTPKGLLRVNLDDQSIKIYGHDGTPNSLLINDVTVTFIDSAGNLWVGLEKEGLCLFRRQQDNFICIKSSFNTKNKIPFATVEDISEDRNGTLWLSMNNYGVVRITPDLEKFKHLKNEITNFVPNYFPHSYDGVVLENHDIWIATDGAGINIFNSKTGVLKNVKHDPNDPNSLPSNSVISLTRDKNGFIWASMWAGGITKIDPQTLNFTNYAYDPNADKNSTLGGNNVFSITSDQKDGIWLSIWGVGMQYFRPDDGTFKNFFQDSDSPNGLRSADISHLALHEDKIWITGEAGLEVLDTATGEFEFLFSTESIGFTYVLVVSLDEIYVGTRAGLIKYSYLSKEKHFYSVEDGLSDNEVFYIGKDRNDKLWVATANGISIFSEDMKTSDIYFEQDGIVGNKMSVHGEFFEVGEELYLTGKLGVTIVNPDDLPHNLHTPKTYITKGEYIGTDKENKAISLNHLKSTDVLEVPYYLNSLRFDFTSLSYVFPERNRFKYRLQGWQQDFTETAASERYVRFTNLEPGTYTFEVFSASSNEVWDTQGDNFTFTILAPWWVTWWARLIFVLLVVFAVYLFYRWRMAMRIEREKLLEKKVIEKTEQLETYAKDLKKASDSLTELNSELEVRVEKRTAELQVEISERKVAESKLFHMAFHDSLTGLPNRQWAIQQIERLVKACQEDSKLKFGLMFLDGDRFKQINDTHGHTIGDQLLIASAIRLSELLSKHQNASRLGGDEFTIIIEEFEDIRHLEELAKSIIEAFKQPFDLENNSIHFNLSIGVLSCNSNYKLVPSVLRDADIAMYRAKEAGKGTYRIFDQEMRDTSLELAELESGLHNALKNNDFYLVYQPIMDLRRGTISGFEALIRWEHPAKGNIPPNIFIPIAEESGLIWEIGRWVLDEACRQTKIWHEMDISCKPTISVNLSSSQLRNGGFINVVDDVIKKTGLASEYLILELTETVLIESNDNINQVLEALGNRNIDLAIDDFGTGYSSLSYLSELPVQYIKIDRKFVDAIDYGASENINLDALEIVKATISLGQSLRKKVTAEGIESEAQFVSLIDFGCDYAQGYYIAKPLVAEQTQALLQSGLTAVDDNNEFKRANILEVYRQAVKTRRNRRRDMFK